MARIIIQFELLKPTDDVLANHRRAIEAGDMRVLGGPKVELVPNEGYIEGQTPQGRSTGCLPGRASGVTVSLAQASTTRASFPVRDLDKLQTENGGSRLSTTSVGTAASPR
jgi:hypothetical protein